MITNDRVMMNVSWTVPAGGERSPTDQSKLANQYRLPMLIDEIRFASLEGIRVSGAGDAWRVAGLRMFKSQIKMICGSRWLTRDFVPGDLFAQRPDGDGEIVIRLDEPIYLGANDIIHPTVRAPPAQDVMVQFTLIGRLTPERERGMELVLPYWTSYASPVVASGNTGSFKSTRAQLNNQFRVPLRVKRLMGTVAPSGGIVTGEIAPIDAVRIRVSDQDGNTLVRDPVNFNDLFQVRDHSWPVETVLPPNGYYIIHSDLRAGSLPSVSFRISMLGYRKETVL